MICADAVPLLPWLLNRTLPAEEEAAVRAHLRECPACRRELDATREAWQLLDAHPPAAEVVAHAMGSTSTSAEVAAHLERCAACRLEVGLIRDEVREESRAQGEESNTGDGETAASRSPNAPPERAVAPAVAVFPVRTASTGGARQLLALAATIVAVFAGAGWLVTWQRLQSTDSGAAARQGSLERRIAELEETLQSAPSPEAAAPVPSAPPIDGERLATLERELAGLRQPQGLAVIELLSEEMVLRGAAAPPAVPRDRPATLLLVADGLAAGSRYRIRVGTGAPLWEGITRVDNAGVLALHLPAASVPPGEHVLRVLTLGGEPVASYRLAVR